MCIGIEDVVRVSNISSQTFEEEYAYKAKPIIVTDATAGWKAVNVSLQTYKSKPVKKP